MKKKIAILAAGTWGTALAVSLSKSHNVIVWSMFEEEVNELSQTKHHKNLPGMVIPDSVVFTTDMEKTINKADIIIFAVPSIGIRSTAEKVKPYLKDNQIIVTVTKGMESGTLFTMSEVINAVLQAPNPIVALSGPTHAEEVAQNIPTLIVSASADSKAAEIVQGIFKNTCIRPYTNNDIKGIELCGALKNIIALACGIAMGIGYGDNTRAAIITRGMAEIKRLGTKMGCDDETFYGLAGIGDLIVTATSTHSRNYNAGYYIGQGLTAEQAINKVGMVVEGINALKAAVSLGEMYNVELPMINAVYEVVYNNVPGKEACVKLFSRMLKSEKTGLRYEDEMLNSNS